MSLEFEEVGEISIHPIDGGWRTNITRKIRERLGITEKRPHRVVVLGIKNGTGMVLLVDKKKMPRKKDFIESVLGIPLKTLEFSLPEGIYDLFMKANEKPQRAKH
jgi:hypothetical protein